MDKRTSGQVTKERRPHGVQELERNHTLTYSQQDLDSSHTKQNNAHTLIQIYKNKHEVFEYLLLSSRGWVRNPKFKLEL